jgi:hypothetical protein
VNATERGNHAKRLLEDPLLAQAFDEVGAQLMMRWQSSGPDESKLREQLWATYSCLGEAQRVLRTWLQDGQIEQGWRG